MQILHHAQDILRLWISMDINGYHDLEDVDVVCLPDLLGHAKLREIFLGKRLSFFQDVLPL